MRIALFQPDIAQNLGTMLRTAACFGVAVEIIEPCGFPFYDKKFRRAGMDYIDKVECNRHKSWHDFKLWQQNLNPKPRIIALSSKVKIPYYDFTFKANDILLLGRETSGLPEEVYGEIDATLTIPMQPDFRSLNVAIAGAIVLSEALRQIVAFPIFK